MNSDVYVSVATRKQMEDVVVNHGFELDDFYEFDRFKDYEDETVLILTSDNWQYGIRKNNKDKNIISYSEYMKKFGRTDDAETPEEDMINHPSHYNSYSFEVIDIIDEVVPNFDSSVAGHIQNAIKYIFRAPFKGTLRDDLKKAVWYLNHAIEIIDKEQTGDEQSNTTN